MEISSPHKPIAQEFLGMLINGQIDEAYEKHVSQSFIHHNQYFKGDRESLRVAMIEDHAGNPEKQFVIKKVIEENGIVVTYSNLHFAKTGKSYSVMHMMRFSGDKIVEMWDNAQEMLLESPNENGPF